MRRCRVVELAAAGMMAVLIASLRVEAAPAAAANAKLVGMYVHECWVYNHPYASRTWTYDDWHGYLDGLHRLGFNLVVVWPMLETMPDPLNQSDKAALEKMRKVVDAAHHDFQMKVWIVLCPNIVPIDEHARRAGFEQRSFFASDRRVNPADAKAIDAMMARRETLLKPLAQADALAIIDSDPGGYPNSTNKEFIDLLMRHRQLLDRLRPGGVELIYWAWAGWPSYARYYATGNFDWGTKPEFIEAFTLLKERNPEPWGLAPSPHSAPFAREAGLESRIINFNYNAIEGEPTFPMTNFGGNAAYDAGKNSGSRGVVGNAQTHCIQLPNTFAFAQGARGLPLNDADYVQFADQLIVGHGKRIFSAWQALAGADGKRMRQAADQLSPLVKAQLEPGPLKGLLFGDPNRFIRDLQQMLRAKAASLDFIAASNQKLPILKPYADCVNSVERWQLVTGYEGFWNWSYVNLRPSLDQLGSSALQAAFVEGSEGHTPMDRVAADIYRNERQTLRVIQAMRRTLLEMSP